MGLGHGLWRPVSRRREDWGKSGWKAGNQRRPLTKEGEGCDPEEMELELELGTRL